MISMKVCTYPMAEISVAHDIDIIKSILLYADKIELVSPNTTMLLSAISIPYLPEKDRVDFIEKVFPLLENDQDSINNMKWFVSEYRRLEKKKRKVGTELREFMQIKKGLKDTWSVLDESYLERFSGTGIEELLLLIESGILTINMIGKEEDDFETNKFTELLKDNIIDSITNKNYYPLFDEKIGKFIGSMNTSGYISISSAKKERTNHIAFTSNILNRLPIIAKAPIDEIIDIRDDLSEYLIRFRSAMEEYSSQIKNLPWNDDFSFECDKIINSKLLPVIEEIEEQVNGNNYLRKMFSNLLTKPIVTPSATGIGFIVSTLSALPTLTGISTGLAVGATINILDSLNEWKVEKRKIECNHLFFYYKAGKLAI